MAEFVEEECVHPVVASCTRPHRSLAEIGDNLGSELYGINSDSIYLSPGAASVWSG
jgi:hypothetical protein